MRNANLESVVVESSNQCSSTSVELLLQNLKQRVAVAQTLAWVAHHAQGIPDGFVQTLYLCAPVVASLE